MALRTTFLLLVLCYAITVAGISDFSRWKINLSKEKAHSNTKQELVPVRTLEVNADKDYYVELVTPANSPISGGQQVNLIGFFFNSTRILVSFVQVTNSSNFVVVKGTYVDNETVTCETPQVTQEGDYFVRVSEDGLDYTSNALLINFFGSENHSEEWEILMGIIVLIALFSLTGTAVGVYFYRKKKEQRNSSKCQNFLIKEMLECSLLRMILN